MPVLVWQCLSRSAVPVPICVSVPVPVCPVCRGGFNACPGLAVSGSDPGLAFSACPGLIQCLSRSGDYGLALGEMGVAELGSAAARARW